MNNKYLIIVAEGIRVMREYDLKNGLNEVVSGIDSLSNYLADRLEDNLSDGEFDKKEFLKLCGYVPNIPENK